MSDIVSRPFHPGDKCCEKCVFGSGEHAEWCEKRKNENREAFKRFVLGKNRPQLVHPIQAEFLESQRNDDRCPCWRTGKFVWTEGCKLHPWVL